MRLQLLLLVALCALLYVPGLTALGLSNWQEAQRALVFRDMLQRGDWLVPTVNGQPYLAKPPLIYWAQLALSQATGRTDEWPLRMTVALTGTCGVLCTWWFARALLRALPVRDQAQQARLERIVPTLAAAALATGPLYVRSSRIGELDILLAPTCLAAVASAALAALSPSARSATAHASVACVAAGLAALSKGPPALAVIALGVVALWFALARSASGSASEQASAAHGRRNAAIFGAMIALALGIAANVSRAPANATTVLGLGLFALAGAVLAAAAPDALLGRSGRQVVRWLAMLALVMSCGLLALGSWLWLVAERIGWPALRAAARFEADDNLHLLSAPSPLRNLEALGFGVGVASLALIVASVAALARALGLRASATRSITAAQPRQPLVFAFGCWLALGLIFFSVIGKGVPRYLTPLWPVAAIFASFIIVHAAASRRALVPLAIVGIAALALAQSWWYSIARPARYSDRSPRDLLRAWSAPHNAQVPVLALDHWSPALDFYLGRPVTSVLDAGPPITVAGVQPIALNQLPELARTSSGRLAMLVRTRARSGIDPRDPIETLQRRGWMVLQPAGLPAHTIDNGRSSVVMVELWQSGGIDPLAAPTPPASAPGAAQGPRP